MVKFSISEFCNFPSSPSLNKFYWSPLIWTSHPVYFYLHFRPRPRCIVSSVLGRNFQLPKFGRIKMLLGLSATLHSIIQNQCLKVYIYKYCVHKLYVIWNCRNFVNTSCYSIEHEVHNVNIQLLHNTHKADPTQYIQYIASTIHMYKRFLWSILILFRYRRFSNSWFILFNFRRNITNFLFTTCIKIEESHQVDRLEQTVLQKGADYKGFVIPRLLYSLIYISWT